MGPGPGFLRKMRMVPIYSFDQRKRALHIVHILVHTCFL